MTVDGYFAASNSGRGFTNYYAEVFGAADRIFVIKGGPGTGKSRFMHEAESYAEARGWSSRRYYCSSDPGSLDGILLRRDDSTVAFLDGTPPHTWEPEQPGVVEQLIDLGAFWDESRLREHSGELRELGRRKRLAWRQAYGWLSGCLDMCRVIRSIGRELTDEQELHRYAASMLAGVERGDGFVLSTALLNAVGMTGQAASCGFAREASVLYLIKDSFMTAHLLLDSMVELARLRGLRVTVSRDPIDPERLDGVLLERDRIAAIVDSGAEKCAAGGACFPVEMASLGLPASEADTEEAMHAHRAYSSMLSGALDALAGVREYHFEMERIYSDAMDFAAKERYTAELCRSVFGE